MDVIRLNKHFCAIAKVISDNRDYLVELDARSGDGDLGISMDAGFSAVVRSLAGTEEKDLGKVLAKCSSVFNEAAPSTMGTIISMGLMGMARTLKGKTEADYAEIVGAMEAGLLLIMEKAKSKPGERTILDSLFPAIDALKNADGSNPVEALRTAFHAAAAGMESTKSMKPLHGRSAYYGEKSIGQLDAGSVVGKLIFEGLLESVTS